VSRRGGDATAACEQAGTIQLITETLGRLEQGQAKMVEVMVEVSDQNARIHSLADREAKTEMEVASIYDRLRLVEVEADRNNRLKEIAVCKPMIAVYTLVGGMIISGSAMDFVFHSEKLKQVIALLRG
jgi:hypothetical protein